MSGETVEYLPDSKYLDRVRPLITNQVWAQNPTPQTENKVVIPMSGNHHHFALRIHTSRIKLLDCGQYPDLGLDLPTLRLNKWFCAEERIDLPET